jgi:hypothetical protein
LQQKLPVETHISIVIQMLKHAHLRSRLGRVMRVAVAAMLLVFLGSSALALAKDGPGVTSPLSTPASNSAASASTSSADAASATTSVSPNALLAVLPDAPPMSDAAPAPIGATELKPAEPLPAGPLSITPSAAAPSLGSAFLANNNLAAIHALVAPPAALIRLKTPPHTHNFFDARNTLGLATLGASLTADALSTQKGLAYPGFVEMNPIARPFVQSRMGAAAYNAGSFGLMAGLMYWAHKTEHHKLERILPFAIGSWEGLLSARNYRVIANRAR